MADDDLVPAGLKRIGTLNVSINFVPNETVLPMTWYQARQLGVVVRCPECTCGGPLDYAYWCLWKCRACGEWVKKW